MSPPAGSLPPELEGYIDPEIYDLTYSWYDSDIGYYVAAAKEARGRVLEVACGTGRVLLPTLQAGVDIAGFDLHPGMLAVLRRKAAALGLEARVMQADMRDFTMPHRYRLITIPFRAFMHLYTKQDQLRTLRAIREHLEPGGRLVFNVFYPCFDAFVDPGHPIHEPRRIPDPATGGAALLRVVTDETDRVNQIKRIARELVEYDAAGREVRVHHDRFHMRWTWKFEMELLLEAAGFQRYDVRGGFDGRPLERDTDEMVWTAWKE